MQKVKEAEAIGGEKEKKEGVILVIKFVRLQSRAVIPTIIICLPATIETISYRCVLAKKQRPVV